MEIWQNNHTGMEKWQNNLFATLEQDKQQVHREEIWQAVTLVVFLWFDMQYNVPICNIILTHSDVRLSTQNISPIDIQTMSMIRTECSRRSLNYNSFVLHVIVLSSNMTPL